MPAVGDTKGLSVSRGFETLRVLARAGLLRAERPDRSVRALQAIRRFGFTPAAGYTAAAARYPDEPAIIDDLGELTFAQVNERTNKLADSWRRLGLREGDQMAVMCRNHRYFIETTVAALKLGVTCLYLNTAFAAPQLTAVLEREQPAALVYDEEFAELLAEGRGSRKCFLAWQDSDKAASDQDPSLEQLIAGGQASQPAAPQRSGRTIILTSGTTGTPKGASRQHPDTIGPAVSLLSKIPLRGRDRIFDVAPLFHTWGFAHFMLGALLSATLILRRKFDPQDTLDTIERHHAQAAPMVPVMLQRIMELPYEQRHRADTSSLRAIPLSGSALPGELAVQFMDEFGDILYNLYGSTEVAWATIATPADLREVPGTAGAPPMGTVVQIYDDQGRQASTGEIGRIFVGNEMLFEGYTGGGSKDLIGGLMATGDRGYLDERGRLFVSGRDDEMIVSGGENVYPREVEDTIAAMSGVTDVAVIGVSDERFGQRLKAFVVAGTDAPSEEEIKDRVKSQLAGFKVPRDIQFVDSLPRNATGKVLKRQLTESDVEQSQQGATAGTGDESS